MRWEDREESENVDDRRRMRTAGVAISGTGTLIVIILALVFGVDPQQLLGPGGLGQPGAQQGGQPGDAGRRSAGRSRGREAGPFRQGDLRRHRTRLDQIVRRAGQRVRTAEAGAVQRTSQIGLRPGQRRGRTVLLRRRQQRLHRPGILRRHAAQAALRRANSPGPTSWRTRSDITSSGCWVIRTWPLRDASAAATATKSDRACGSSCKPTSWPASGPTMPNSSSNFSKRGT